MTGHQLAGVSIICTAYALLAVTVVLVCGGLWITRDGRVGGDRRGGCRRRPGCQGGDCRRGKDATRRVSREEMVDRFVAGEVTLNDMRKFYKRRHG
jgi:hypothetical protein